MERDKREQKKKYSHAAGPSKAAVLLVMFLAAVIILAIAAFRVAADSRKEDNTKRGSAAPTSAQVQSPPAAQSRKIMAITERIEAETKTMQFYSVDDKKVLWLSYTSGTNIVDKYGLPLVAGQLQAGDIVEVSYQEEGSLALSVEISSDTWEYSYQTGIKVGTEREMITAGTRNFMYSEALHVFNGGAASELSAVLDSDSVTMRGIGNEVYVLFVERGHGYLSLSEEQDYIGGSILVNHQYMAQITEDMLLTLKEGTYQVTVEKDDLSATIETTIARDKTTVLDLTEYVRVPDPVGQITFKIEPAGAVLWINGENTYYGDVVELAYGVYEIRVESGGYVPYEGVFRVESAAAERIISLSEAPSEDSTEGEDTGKSTADGSGSRDDSVSDAFSDGAFAGSSDSTSEREPSGSLNSDGSYRTDDNHWIIIYSDDEVEVYLDGDYMGVTEEGKAEFEKFIGTFELELVRGDETKSYMIQVDDDGEDFVFRRYFE